MFAVIQFSILVVKVSSSISYLKFHLDNGKIKAAKHEVNAASRDTEMNDTVQTMNVCVQTTEVTTMTRIIKIVIRLIIVRIKLYDDIRLMITQGCDYNESSS